MRNKPRKVWTWLVAGTLLACQTAALPAANAADANNAAVTSGGAALIDIQNHWAYDTIRWALAKGIVDGYEDRTFRPDKQVSEAEFLAMLVRAYPDAKPAESGTGTPWYEKYYAYADSKQWPVQRAKAQDVCLRGRVAVIVAAAQGQHLGEDAAIQYLLDSGLAEGKTDHTAEGFKKNDPLTRAEAVTFIQNLVAKQPTLSAGPVQSQSAIKVEGIGLGDPVSAVIGKLGEPARKDVSEYGFEWYVYNRDYKKYAQIGVQNGKVVALYGYTADWTSDKGIRAGSSASEVTQKYGDPLDYILKGNTRFMLSDSKVNTGVYLLGSGYVTFFYDKFQNNAVMAVQAVEKSVEESLTDFYGPPSDALRRSYELEAFDLANAARASAGKQPFEWDDKLAEIARQHSEDMAKRNYFEHNDLEGRSPFDRMKAAGLAYRMAAENIAAGTTSAIFAHAGWMNSEGHRANIFRDVERLGVGVSFGGEMHVYYTQDFYTPLK